jgi:hypothetical protein
MLIFICTSLHLSSTLYEHLDLRYYSCIFYRIIFIFPFDFCLRFLSLLHLVTRPPATCVPFHLFPFLAYFKIFSTFNSF